MIGGSGRDIYTVDDIGDVVDEVTDQDADDGALDTVWSTVSFMLGPRVENLRLQSGDIDGTGNELANLITGSAGRNVIAGGTGIDSLYGKGGADVFVFAEKGKDNKDSIWDFDADDRIQLRKQVFSGLDADGDGVLDAGALTFGYRAAATNAQIVYDAKTGNLSYEADGTGGAPTEVIAMVGKNLSFLDSGDILLA
ncbi:hypothetical protein [Aureimonas phyllosphaerae]|uniref:Ca2+-binding RTX toxin-like protein n=1 Tax=Aureimonas phyllosphaerae TaxID=1166078 RepID=A0A7W6C403_9HYPH|nr:hypothetical protein [Aureimonas phyllosphaerae]MBB3938037.1 Ca2+-binding RTX toxin-like protein [Aureimonas phyllosphaerae]MBB3962044.1 Ca2+-binding RTX toxin-like protein [Aureimonas phyllosphaerae]SFF54179.1 serralysin [Aureimonas phyllosphaerae]